MNDTDETPKGSRNAEARLSEGWVIGSARYANTEPHHVRHEGGAWTYQEMHHAARDRPPSVRTRS